MNSVENSLIRAAAFRVLRRAPWWVAATILIAGFLLERGH